MGASGLMARGPPPSPAWVTYIRYAILGLALICLAMGAWATAIFGSDWGYIASGGAGGLVIFVAILTFIVYGGAFALEIYSPNNFFRIGFLIGYIFSIIFWLSAWAWSASLASFWVSWSSAYFGRTNASDPIKQLGAALAVAAALGAVIWVLAIVNLVMFIKACVADPGSQQNAELGNIKHQAAGYPAPAAYPAQPYGAPQPQAYPQTQAYPQPQAYPQQPAASPYGQNQPYATQ